MHDEQLLGVDRLESMWDDLVRHVKFHAGPEPRSRDDFCHFCKPPDRAAYEAALDKYLEACLIFENEDGGPITIDNLAQMMGGKTD